MNHQTIRSASAGKAAAAAGLLLAAKDSVLLYLTVGTIVFALSVVIGVATLSRRKFRRDAACAVLKLIFSIQDAGPPTETK